MQTTIIDFKQDSRIDARVWLESAGLKESQSLSVLRAFAGCPKDGATDMEVAEVLDIERTSVIARRHDLIRKFPDLFFVVGKRLSKKGVLCDVWKVKELI